VWNPLFYLFNGLADLIIIGLMFHLLHNLLFSLSSNLQGRGFIYTNYALLSIFAILIITGTGIAFDCAAREIWYYNHDLFYDKPEGEYTAMAHLFIATDAIYALFAVYWLVIAIVVFTAGGKMQVPSSAAVSIAHSWQGQVDLTQVNTV
jgi:hypothetical protein